MNKARLNYVDEHPETRHDDPVVRSTVIYVALIIEPSNDMCMVNIFVQNVFKFFTHDRWCSVCLS